MKTIHPIALFRLSVLGPLACRDTFKRGDLTQIIQELSEKSFDIPGSKNSYLSKKTIENWYQRWRQGGIDALIPQRIICISTHIVQSQAIRLNKRLQFDIIVSRHKYPCTFWELLIEPYQRT